MPSLLPRVLAAGALLAAILPVPASALETAVDIAIDAAAARHPISPLIYGLGFATTEQLRDLNVPLNRSGGDSATLFNWRLNARNAGKDWFFESLSCGQDIFDQHGDGFVLLSQAGKALPMLTVPMIGWVARLDHDRKPLASFSIGKYGLQQEADLEGFAEAGNGITLDGTAITDNDPNDAAQPDTPDDQREWIAHLVDRFGPAARGGVRYYLMDNEPSFWHSIHRDVHPRGAHAKEVKDLVLTYSRMVKAVDPTARVVAPEEWGWTAYHYSGFDQQYAVDHGFAQAPDRRTQTGGMDYLPWLLTQWKDAGHPVDVVSVHFYPQGGEYKDNSDDLSPAIQLLRNRSTRDLWDPAYRDPTWINAPVALIPLLRHWVDTYYDPGTPIAITEYNWGGEGSMNGATAQADVLGIFGREGLDMATRWATPATGTPTYLAIKLYRNYDDAGATFGDISVHARVPDPDTLAVFAAERTSDGALTLMAINKQLDQEIPVTLSLANFPPQGSLDTVRLAEGRLATLAPSSYARGRVTARLPAQSVTLFVLNGRHP